MKHKAIYLAGGIAFFTGVILGSTTIEPRPVEPEVLVTPGPTETITVPGPTKTATVKVPAVLPDSCRSLMTHLQQVIDLENPLGEAAGKISDLAHTVQRDAFLGDSTAMVADQNALNKAKGLLDSTMSSRVLTAKQAQSDLVACEKETD